MSEEPVDRRRSGVLRAFSGGAGGRRSYDQVGVFIKIVRDLGFPIVVAWYALTRLPVEIEKVMEKQQRVINAQQEILVSLLVAQQDSQQSQAAALNATLNESRRLSDIILDRANIMIKGARTKPTTIIINPPAPVVVPPPAPKLDLSTPPLLQQSPSLPSLNRPSQDQMNRGKGGK